MELNWTTFVLEIFNFLILVWILKHFLYKPVLNVIDRRRAGIEKNLDDATALRADAERMHSQYETRLSKWNQERQEMRESLAREIEEERKRKIEELQNFLVQEREKAQVTETRRRADDMHKIEESALIEGARFATRLLEQASGPDTQSRLVDMVIDELTRLPTERIAALHNTYGQLTNIVVSCAFPLPDKQRRRLEKALARVVSPNSPLEFEEKSDLLAGVRITIGAWVVGANLLDELKGFVALTPYD